MVTRVKPAERQIVLFVHSSEALRAEIGYKIKQSKDALENAVGLSGSALKQAKAVYDDALTLIANMKALSVPEIDLEKLRTNALEALKEVHYERFLDFFKRYLIRMFVCYPFRLIACKKKSNDPTSRTKIGSTTTTTT